MFSNYWIYLHYQCHPYKCKTIGTVIVLLLEQNRTEQKFYLRDLYIYTSSYKTFNTTIYT